MSLQNTCRADDYVFPVQVTRHGYNNRQTRAALDAMETENFIEAIPKPSSSTSKITKDKMFAAVESFNGKLTYYTIIADSNFGRSFV